MRVSTAFNKMLGIVGASVATVTFLPEGAVVGLRRRRGEHRCPCGWKTWSTYDRSIRRWRHLDLGSTRCFLEAEICRVDCRRCGKVRTEVVPWARPGARHTRDLQDVVAWLAQHTDKTTITKLLRVSWEAVAHIVTIVVADGLDDARFEGLLRIGVDEISYRKGHRFLTVVADHDQEGAVVWAGEGKDAAALRRFYDLLGQERCARLEAVSLDMGAAYKSATDARAPDARQCVDPFHLVQLANRAVDKSRRWAWNEVRRRQRSEKGPLGRSRTMRTPEGWIKQTRWALLKDPDSLKDSQLAILHALRREHSALYRAWQLKEGLRDLYRVSPADAPAHLQWWLGWACRCRIPAFVGLAKTVRANRERILAAIELDLSNSKLEAAEVTEFLPGTIGYLGYGPDQTLFWPYYGIGAGNVSEAVTYDTVPLGEVAVRRGGQVHATDGDIGRVQGLVINPSDRHVTHVLLQEGHLWGRKQVVIPIRAVAGVDDGIRLNITKQQVQDLPPVDIDHSDT